MQITNVGFIRDHSGSMYSLANGAMQDFNLMLESIKSECKPTHKIFSTVIGCGMGRLGEVYIISPLSPINKIDTINSYVANGGGTPLWKSILTAIKELKDKSEMKDEAFLLIITTDGDNNKDDSLLSRVQDEINNLQATDFWTFVFRVPKGMKNKLVRMGFHPGNIVEWEQTAEALQKVSTQTVASTQAYFNTRSLGGTSTKSFYQPDLSNVTITDIKNELTDITSKVISEPVFSDDDGKAIKDFCIVHFGEYVIGRAYYQLSKTEKVQAQKNIIIKHKKKGKYYGGSDARDLLGLPSGGEIKVVPSSHDQFEIYVQSTSVNRKLVNKTKVLYVK